MTQECSDTIGEKSLRDSGLNMAHLKGVTADDFWQILAEVEEKQTTQRVIVELNYKNGLTQVKLAEIYGVTEKPIYNWLCRLDPPPMSGSIESL